MCIRIDLHVNGSTWILACILAKGTCMCSCVRVYMRSFMPVCRPSLVVGDDIRRAQCRRNSTGRRNCVT